MSSELNSLSNQINQFELSMKEDQTVTRELSKGTVSGIVEDWKKYTEHNLEKATPDEKRQYSEITQRLRACMEYADNMAEISSEVVENEWKIRFREVKNAANHFKSQINYDKELLEFFKDDWKLTFADERFKKDLIGKMNPEIKAAVWENKDVLKTLFRSPALDFGFTRFASQKFEIQELIIQHAKELIDLNESLYSFPHENMTKELLNDISKYMDNIKYLRKYCNFSLFGIKPNERERWAAQEYDINKLLKNDRKFLADYIKDHGGKGEFYRDISTLQNDEVDDVLYLLNKGISLRFTVRFVNRFRGTCSSHVMREMFDEGFKEDFWRSLTSRSFDRIRAIILFGTDHLRQFRKEGAEPLDLLKLLHQDICFEDIYNIPENERRARWNKLDDFIQHIREVRFEKIFGHKSREPKTKGSSLPPQSSTQVENEDWYPPFTSEKSGSEKDEKDAIHYLLSHGYRDRLRELVHAKKETVGTIYRTLIKEFPATGLNSDPEKVKVFRYLTAIRDWINNGERPYK